MSDALKLALRISAIDLFSGVLRHFRDEVAGTGAAAKAMQRDYDRLVSNTSAGLKSLAVGGYLVEKMKPMVEQAVDFQDAMFQVKGLLQNQYDTATQLNDVMGRISQNAKDVAGHMMYNAIAVMDVQRQLVQAGVPVAAILDRTDGHGKVHHGAAYEVEAFAEVNNLDPATTARNIANIAHAFQLTADQYGPMANTIEKAINLGSGDATQFFHNMENFGAIAHLGNTSVRDASIALKAIAPLGEVGGSDLGAAMSYAFGGSQRGSKHLEEYGLNFYDKQHKFIGLFPMIDKLHAYIDDHHLNEEQRNKLLARGFQQTGMKVLALLLEADKPGAKSFHAMDRDFDKQTSLAEMIATRESGAKMAWQEAITTIQSTEATLFDPLLPQLTAVAKLTNEWAAGLGKLAAKHPAFAKGVSYAAEGAVGVAAGYGIFRLIKAAGAGSSLLKNFLKGTGSVATGVAQGKAIEKLTGVTPVFVTNWPGNFGIGMGGMPKPPSGTEAAGSEAEVVGAKGASAAAESIAANAAKGATTAEAAAANAMKDATAAESAAAKASSAVEHIAATGVEGASIAGWSTKGLGLLKGMRWIGALDALAWAPMPDPNDHSTDAQLAKLEKKPSFWATLFHHGAHAAWESLKNDYADGAGVKPVQSPHEPAIAPDLWKMVNGAYVGGAAADQPALPAHAAAPITVVAKAAQPAHEPALAPDFWKMINGAYVAGAAAKPAPPTKLEGDIRIRIDQDNRVRVTQVKTNQPNVHVDVGTMLGVP